MLSLSQLYEPKFIIIFSQIDIFTMGTPVVPGVTCVLPTISVIGGSLLEGEYFSLQILYYCPFSRPLLAPIVAVLFLQETNSETEFVVQVVYHEVLLGSTCTEERRRNRTG